MQAQRERLPGDFLSSEKVSQVVLGPVNLAINASHFRFFLPKLHEESHTIGFNAAYSGFNAVFGTK